MREDFPTLPQTGLAIPINRARAITGIEPDGEPESSPRETKTYRVAAGLDGTLFDQQLNYDISVSWSKRERDIGGHDMFIQNMGFHLGLRKERPNFHRFDYTQKAEYWAVIWGTVPVAFAGFLVSDPVQDYLRDPKVVASTTAGFGLLLWLADVRGRIVRLTAPGTATVNDVWQAALALMDAGAAGIDFE